jgi:hypothetical protein
MQGDVRELPMQASGGDGLLVTPIDMAHPATRRDRQTMIAFNGRANVRAQDASGALYCRWRATPEQGAPTEQEEYRDPQHP